MSRLTEVELQRARALEDWNALWLAADPWVKFAMSELHCGDDDAFQCGREAAGRAVRTWCPEKGAFSTHIKNRVRGELLKWLNAQGSAGVGSRRQARDKHIIQVISLNDPFHPSPSFYGMTAEDALEAEGTHQDNLTYDDLDDFESINAALIGLDARGQLLAALDRLPSDESKFLREVMRHGGISAFSRAVGVPQPTVSTRVTRIVKKLSDNRWKTWYIQGTGKRSSRGFLPGGEDFGAYRWQRAMLGPSIKIESSIHSSGNPWADWSWKPTREDVRNGSEPRKIGYPWSAGARKILGLKAKEDS